MKYVLLSTAAATLVASATGAFATGTPITPIPVPEIDAAAGVAAVAALGATVAMLRERFKR